MRWLPSILFSAVCLLSGSLWLLPLLDSSLASELCVLGCGAVFAAAVIWGGIATRVGVVRLLNGCNWALALSGIGSLGAPALLLLAGRQHFSSIMAVATQTGVPVITAIVGAAVSDGGQSEPHFFAGLTALAGTLLILPVTLPESSRGWIGFACYLAAACLTGASSVFCHREMVRRSRGVALANVSLANGVFVGAASAVWLTLGGHWRSAMMALSASSLLATGVAAASMLGVVALLYLLSPEATAARFVFAPLIAAAEAYLLMRPTLSGRTLFGAALMLVGGIACLRIKRETT